MKIDYSLFGYQCRCGCYYYDSILFSNYLKYLIKPHLERQNIMLSWKCTKCSRKILVSLVIKRGKDNTFYPTVDKKLVG